VVLRLWFVLSYMQQPAAHDTGTCIIDYSYSDLAKTVRKPQRGGVNFDPPMVFCACSMHYAKYSSCFRNTPDSRAAFTENKKFYPKNVFWGPRLAVVTSPPYTNTYSSQKSKN
jgi:hypothetical protein